MRRIINRIMLASLFLAVLSVGSGTFALTLITEEFPPFNYTDNGNLTGVTTEVVREIARRLEIANHIQVLPWARGYQRLCNEPDVVLFTTARTPERESQFQWVGPLYAFRLGFYAIKGAPLRIDSLEAAKKVSAIATYKNDFREQILKSLGFSNLDSSKDPKSNIRKLVSGRVDLWFFDNIGVPKVARAAGIDPDRIKLVYTHQQHESYIAISKQTSPEISRRWQAALDEMKADGTFWWLARKWLEPDAIVMTGRRSPHVQPSPLQLYTEDSPPSSYMEKGHIKGLSVELVQEILRRIGQPDTLSMVPWARGYNLALTSPGIALFSTTRLPQRETLFQWVGPLYLQRWGFYRWKGSDIHAPDLEAARQVDRIGTYHQDAKMQFLSAQGFKNLIPSNKNATNIKHLQRGNIDLWVSSDFNMPHLVRQAGVSPDQLELACTFRTVGNYIAFSKGTSPHVTRLWQAVLDEMKADESYLRICRRYNYVPE